MPQKYYYEILDSVIKQIKEITNRKVMSENNVKEWLLEVKCDINKSLDGIDISSDNFSDKF